jgi:predicted nucleotidyltransferase/uncharacterized protein (UPF0332 family)
MTKKKVEKEVKTIPIETPKLTSERDIAYDFATKVHEKFDKLVKASILFGSQAKNTATATSDIDLILIIDDASINWDIELVAWYREELGKLVSSLRYGKELHINSIKLTTWWNDLMQGDPVIINIIRYGEVLIDSGGFFNPFKALLAQGQIHSTPEAVYTALQRAPTHLARSKFSQMSAIEGVYWCMIDSAQAALMTSGKLPPSPEHVPAMLKENFVDKGMLKIEAVKDMRDIYVLHKAIAHGEVKSVKGIEIDAWQQKAEKFMLEMTRIIDLLLTNKK